MEKTELENKVHKLVVEIRTEGRIYGKEERNAIADTGEIMDVVEEYIKNIVKE